MHEPVLLREVLGLLASRPGLRVVDATVGAGGHARALLESAGPGGLLLGIDQDPAALAAARGTLAAFGDRARLVEGDYGDLEAHVRAAGLDAVDAVLVDCGVSSLQLDDPARGLSFRHDGPLDMRLSPRRERSAADIVNEEPADRLADLFYAYGEERASRRIARRIAERRRVQPIRTTAELAEIVARAAGGRRGGRIHPATRVFQALRIAVNGELDSLERLLAAAPRVLVPGGRLAVISFHSLEDRRVKQAFRDGARGGVWRVLTRKPLRPGSEEAASNPRSRSARLRAADRI